MPKNAPTGFAAHARLGPCAKANMLIVCRCGRCRKSVTYLAADLFDHFTEMASLAERHRGVELVGLRIIGELWGKCPQCGGAGEHWSERERYATTEDVGHLLIRRPQGFRQIRQWRDEWYGPPTKPPA